MFIQRCKEKHGPAVNLIIASGGNAGLAAAFAAKAIEVRCTVFLPEGASQGTLGVLNGAGAKVIMVGKCYQQTLEHAKEAAASDSNAFEPFSVYVKKCYQRVLLTESWSLLSTIR